MALPTQKFHEIVFQMLYSYELGEKNADLFFPVIMKELQVTKSNVRKAEEKVQAIRAHRKELEEIMQRYSTAYDISRIHTVEKYVLLLALYEMVIEKTDPRAVIIAEAKRLSRKFSTKESETFIFAILSQVADATE